MSRLDEHDQNLYKVLIIGAGQIGAFYDTPDSEEIISHAHAFHHHPGFVIAGFIDERTELAEKAARIWGGQAFGGLEQALACQPDVVCIAVPDEWHFHYLKALAGRKDIRVIMAEKPLTATLEEARLVREIYAGSGPPVVVDYVRRFVPELATVRREISSGQYGEYVTGTGYYGKGLLHSGSHMVDLVRFFLGEVKPEPYVYRLEDHYDDDPSLSALLTTDNGRPFFLQAVDSRPYSFFEMDLIFTACRVRIVDAALALEVYQLYQDPMFPDLNKLVLARKERTSLFQATYLIADNIYQYLTGSADLVCSLEDAYQAMKDCMVIRGEIKE